MGTLGSETHRDYSQHILGPRKNLKRIVMSTICSLTHPLPGGTQNLGQAEKHFLTHFFNFGHEGAPNVTKITYNIIILWENSHRKKNWGSFVHRGLRYDFLRKKIWTVPLILQFNIYRRYI